MDNTCNMVATLVNGRMMNNDISDLRVEETLEHAGISRTPQRLAVLKVLQSASQPLSVNLIRGKLRVKTRINKVTVYRTVSLFKRKGIVRDVSITGGAVYFEMATSDHPAHPHFSCKNCGMLNCMTPLTLSQARQLTDARDDWRIDHIEINISGLCNNCLQATKLPGQPEKKGP